MLVSSSSSIHRRQQTIHQSLGLDTIPHFNQYHQQHNIKQFTSLQNPIYNNTMNINLISLGADPLGVNDSTSIIQQAINLASEYRNIYNVLIKIDLEGGNYLISSPIYLNNSKYNGIIIGNGQITVNPDLFLNTDFIFYCIQCSQITWMDLVLENHHIGGGILTDTGLQNVIDNVFFLHYNTMGIFGDSKYGMGHELLVSNSVFAEYMWGEPNYNITSKQNGTAIYMTYPDSNFYNIIIRCTKVGVINKAGANLYHGVHIYSSCNKNPNGENIAVGYLSNANQNRITNCYFDDSPLVFTDIWAGTITNNLFYGFSGIILAPQQNNIWINGIIIKNNLFTATPYSQPSGPMIHYSTNNGTVDVENLSGVIVSDNVFSIPNLEKTTKVTSTIIVNGTVVNGNMLLNFSLNISDSLLFNNDNNSNNRIQMGNNDNWRWDKAIGKDIFDMFMQQESMVDLDFDNGQNSNINNGKIKNINTSPFTFSQLQGTVTFLSAYDTDGNTVAPFTLNIVPVLNLSPMYSTNNNKDVLIQHGIIDGRIYIFNNNPNNNYVNYTFSLLVTVNVDQSLPTGSLQN